MNAPEKTAPSDRCGACGSSLMSAASSEAVCPACVAASLLAGEGETPCAGELVDEDSSLSWVEIAGFDVLECLGQGGMGAVFRARQHAPKRHVAIKVLSSPGVITSPEARHRFEREIELAGRLRHPGIVPIYESGLAREGGIFYYVMELVEGRSLDRYIAEDGPPRDARLALFEKLCAAVVYAHRNGVIHRDLTPANILVNPVGEPRLLDFGLGKHLTTRPENDASLELSLQNSILGSPCTMSPEQAAGKADVDTRSDVYSLGAILYHLLTGEWPHDQEGDVVDVLHRIAHEPIRPAARFVGDLDRGLRAILDKALTTDRERRYQSASELVADVERYRGKEELSVQPLTAWQRLNLWRRRRPMSAALWGVSALLVFTLAVGGPIVALQQARMRTEVNEREVARLRSLLRAFVAADSSNVLTLYQAIEDDLSAMTSLLREELRSSQGSRNGEIRLKAALFPSTPELKDELVHVLKNSSDLADARLLTYVLRHQGDELANAFRAAVQSGQMAPKSRVCFNHYLALATWISSDATFWNEHSHDAAVAIMAASHRQESGASHQLKEAFLPVRAHLKAHLESLAVQGHRAAKILLSGFIEDPVREMIETALDSDEVFREGFSRLEGHRMEAIWVLTALYEEGRSSFRELPAGSAERERLGRVAVALIRLDRETPVWRQLGYSWPMREILIEKLPKLGASPALLHWKLRRTNGRSKLEEGTRSALARCFVEFRPEDLPTEMRENIIKRQREVLSGKVPTIEREPMEAARKLLQAWGNTEEPATEQ